MATLHRGDARAGLLPAVVAPRARPARGGSARRISDARPRAVRPPPRAADAPPDMGGRAAPRLPLGGDGRARRHPRRLPPPPRDDGLSIARLRLPRSATALHADRARL